MAVVIRADSQHVVGGLPGVPEGPAEGPEDPEPNEKRFISSAIGASHIRSAGQRSGIKVDL